MFSLRLLLWIWLKWVFYLFYSWKHFRYPHIFIDHYYNFFEKCWLFSKLFSFLLYRESSLADIFRLLLSESTSNNNIWFTPIWAMLRQSLGYLAFIYCTVILFDKIKVFEFLYSYFLFYVQFSYLSYLLICRIEGINKLIQTIRKF